MSYTVTSMPSGGANIERETNAQYVPTRMQDVASVPPSQAAVPEQIQPKTIGESGGLTRMQFSDADIVAATGCKADAEIMAIRAFIAGMPTQSSLTVQAWIESEVQVVRTQFNQLLASQMSPSNMLFGPHADKWLDASKGYMKTLADLADELHQMLGGQGSWGKLKKLVGIAPRPPRDLLQSVAQQVPVIISGLTQQLDRFHAADVALKAAQDDIGQVKRESGVLLAVVDLLEKRAPHLLTGDHGLMASVQSILALAGEHGAWLDVQSGVLANARNEVLILLDTRLPALQMHVTRVSADASQGEIGEAHLVFVLDQIRDVINL